MMSLNVMTIGRSSLAMGCGSTIGQTSYDSASTALGHSAMQSGIPEIDITLRDGRVVHVRAIGARDESEILQAFDRMSAHARYMRFMRVVREPNLDRLRKALASFPERGVGLVATVPATDGFDIVGSAVAIIEGDATSCEFAINVDSRFGGAGLATALMKKLIETARGRGVKVMEGFVLAENQSMLRLASRLGFGIAPDPEDRAVRVCRLQLGSA
jgi:acetyltransferase